MKTLGYATKRSYGRLRPFEYDRPEAGPNEVEISVLFCGVCHSDLHQVKNEWGNTVYSCMPGHEVVGRVTRTGAAVTRHKIGDLVGVGCMIDSCRHCTPCNEGDQNYCEGPNSWLATYNGPMLPKAKSPDGTNHYGRDNTYGGYSEALTVAEDFVLKIPAGMDPAKAAPILCAGVTTYSPMKHWGVKPGDHIGIIGLGGLGHMAVKLARAMGAQVTVFTTSANKRGDALALGAEHVAIEGDKKAMEAMKLSLDFILTTVPEKHDLMPFLPLLKRDKTLVIVGALEPMAPVNNQMVASHRYRVAGSLIGNLADTQEVLDFCAQHGIAPDIQVIPIQDINDAYKSIERGDVRYRYVIDMASLQQDKAAQDTATQPAEPAIAK